MPPIKLFLVLQGAAIDYWLSHCLLFLNKSLCLHDCCLFCISDAKMMQYPPEALPYSAEYICVCFILIITEDISGRNFGPH